MCILCIFTSPNLLYIRIKIRSLFITESIHGPGVSEIIKEKLTKFIDKRKVFVSSRRETKEEIEGRCSESGWFKFRQRACCRGGIPATVSPVILNLYAAEEESTGQ